MIVEGHLATNSTGGGAYQVNVPVGEHRVLADDIPVTTALVYVTTGNVFINIAGRAGTDKFLMPPNVVFTVPVANLNLVHIYNGGAGASVVYILYRTR